MDTIRAALDAGTAPILLEAAAHELGHAITWRHAGYRVSHLVVTRGLFGGVGTAYCQLTRTPHLDQPTAQGYLVGLLGGLAAHQRLLTHLRRGTGSARGHASHDLREFRRLAPHWPGRYSSTGAATTRATAIVAGYGHHRLDRLTVRLATAGRLSGAAL